jgi:hypothetical protein
MDRRERRGSPDAPLKFRAPGLELRVGLAIGRIGFRALNIAEAVWAVVIAAMLIVHTPSVLAAVAGCGSIAVLVVKLLLIRPRLNRRSDRVLAGADAPRSRSHHAYIAAEAGKVVALAVLAAALLAAL